MLKVIYYEMFYKMKFYTKHVKHLNLYEKPLQKLLIPSTFTSYKDKKGLCKNFPNKFHNFNNEFCTAKALSSSTNYNEICVSVCLSENLKTHLSKSSQANQSIC